MQQLERALLRLNYLLRQRSRHNRLALERFEQFNLVVLPGVMNPRIFRSGAYFSSVLQQIPLQHQQRILDMGCGSGIMAVTAALRCERVVAVDINPAAVCCTTINALLNELHERVVVRQGDLFSAVGQESFDLILFNPPFFRGAPQPGFEQAWRSTDALERFAAQLQQHLRPAGAALLLWSSHADEAAFLQTFRAQGYGCEPFARRRFLAETMTVFRVSAP